jgi:hypothetical protein
VIGAHVVFPWQLCANSVYGFFGASVNSLFARELGDSTLALGREYLLRAISLVHQHYPFLKVSRGMEWWIELAGSA